MRWENAPAAVGCPQLGFEVEVGNVEAPNPRTVEAKRRSKGPPQRHATEGERGPDQPPQGVPHEHDPSVLKDTGTCKPEGVLTALERADPGRLEGGMSHHEVEPPVLKDATPEDLEEKTRHIEGESWEGFEEPWSPHAETTEQRPWALSPANKEAPHTHKNRVSMAGIEDTDGHEPSLPLPITLGHSFSGYPCSFRARMHGRRRCHHRWKDKV